MSTKKGIDDDRYEDDDSSDFGEKETKSESGSIKRGKQELQKFKDDINIDNDIDNNENLG